MGDEFGLVQIIEEPTRGENTLDLIYTNETSMIIQVENIKSTLSDHDRIEVTTNIKTKNEEEIIEIIIKLCKKYIPEKKSRNKNTIPKRRRQLFQKMKLLRSKRNANKRKKEIDNKILEV